LTAFAAHRTVVAEAIERGKAVKTNDKEDKGSDATTNIGDNTVDCFDLTDKEDFDPEFSLQDVHNIDIRA
jgi:hypothetical protein